MVSRPSEKCSEHRLNVFFGWQCFLTESLIFVLGIRRGIRPEQWGGRGGATVEVEVPQ